MREDKAVIMWSRKKIIARRKEEEQLFQKGMFELHRQSSICLGKSLHAESSKMWIAIWHRLKTRLCRRRFSAKEVVRRRRKKSMRRSEGGRGDLQKRGRRENQAKGLSERTIEDRSSLRMLFWCPFCSGSWNQMKRYNILLLWRHCNLF